MLAARRPGLRHYGAAVVVASPTVSDTFTRANSTSVLGTADTGQVWSQTTGTWGISSDQAYCTALVSGESLASIQVGNANMTAQVQITDLSGGAGVDLAFRITDASNFWLFDYTGSGYVIYKRVAGTFTAVSGNMVAAPKSGDVTKIVCSGSTISAYVNGTFQLSVTDSFNSTATLAGMRTAGLGGRLFDNFQAS